MKRYIGAITLVATCVAMLLIMSTAAMARETRPTEASSAFVECLLFGLDDFPRSSQSAAPSGTGIIRGTVLDYAGQPVSGAYLMWLTGDSGPVTAPRQTRRARTRSPACRLSPAPVSCGWCRAGTPTSGTSAEGSRSSTPAPARSTSGRGGSRSPSSGEDRGLGDRVPRSICSEATEPHPSWRPLSTSRWDRPTRSPATPMACPASTRVPSWSSAAAVGPRGSLRRRRSRCPRAHPP